jgi:hypothetical protein
LRFVSSLEQASVIVGLICIPSWARIPGREDDVVLKLLSVNPEEYPDAPAEGIRQILEMCGQLVPRGTPLDLTSIESIRMGTTVATKYVSLVSLFLELCIC